MPTGSRLRVAETSPKTPLEGKLEVPNRLVLECYLGKNQAEVTIQTIRESLAESSFILEA